MKLILDKINIIDHAEIELNGLTVIVGENNSGKSTIGRILFSLTKALNNTFDVNATNINNKVRKLIVNLRRRLISEKCEDKYFKDENKPSEAILRSYHTTLDFERDLHSYSSIDEFARDKISIIDNLEISPRMKTLLKRDIDNIAVTLNNSQNRGALFSTEFSSVSESEFLNQLSTEPGSKMRLIMEDGIASVDIEYLEGNKAHFKIGNPSGLEDITYIESPLYLHILDLLANASPYHEMGSRSASRLRIFRMVPLHIMDFANKVNSNMDGYLSPNLFDTSIVSDVKDIMGGSFFYESKMKAIMFSQNGREFFPLNVASGIKIFGVLQMLLNGSFIDATKPLVWDEPENHLHPEWQVQFAKLLVQVSASGIPVMVTTHSPYFLQAIRYYAAKEKVEKYVSYYTSERENDGKVRMIDVSNNLEVVFRRLADPLNRIMNIDAVRAGIEL